MDKISKTLQKLSVKEKEAIKIILNKLIAGDFGGLDIKKLKSQNGIYRARKGDLRVLYMINKIGKVVILDICRRNDNTYKFL